jgi:mono/diheme cytochrome c family protein
MIKTIHRGSPSWISGISEAVQGRDDSFFANMAKYLTAAMIAFANSALSADTTTPEGGDADWRRTDHAAVEAGALHFETNCAICHGIDARGNGPFAALLKVQPPDLTGLASANGARFPFSSVYRKIDGRDLPASHGSPGMPVWGRRFLREGGEETYVRGRIFELMIYLESIQAF